MSIFSEQPPEWLQKSTSVDFTQAGADIGQAVGKVATTAGIMASTRFKSQEHGMNFFQKVFDATQTANDPFYLQKAQVLQDQADLQHTQKEQQINSTGEIAKYTKTWQTEGKGKPQWLLDNPIISENPKTMKWMQDAETMASKSSSVEQVKKADSALDSALTKIIGDNTVSGTVRGQAMAILRTQDPVQKQTMSDKLFNDLPATSKPGSPLGKLQTDRESAVKRGDTEAVKQFDAAIEQETTNKGKSIYMGVDDDGKPIFQMTEGGAQAIGKPTTAMKTLAQQKLARYENSMELLNHLSSNLKPEFVGVRGYLGEWFVDKGMQQLAEMTGSPDVVNRERVDARSVLIASRESLLREIQDDKSGRFSVSDREDIAKALPSSGMFESYADAKQRLDTVRNIITQRSKNYAKSIGQSAPLWTLTAQEIKDLYQKNQKDPKQGIDKETALDALVRFHPEALESN